MGKNGVGRNGMASGMRVRELDLAELESAVGGQRSATRDPMPKTMRALREEGARVSGGGGGFWRWLIGG